MPGNKLKLDRINWQKIKYPGLFGCYAATVLATLLFGIRFLERELNLAFTPPSEVDLAGSIAALDLPDYKIVAQKINLPSPDTAARPEQTATTTAPTQGAAAPATSSPATSTDPVAAPAELSIRVENSTKTKGLAATLKQDLLAAGFSRISTANRSGLLATTSLAVKKSLITRPEISVLRQILVQDYQLDETELENSSRYDVLIIIGQR